MDILNLDIASTFLGLFLGIGLAAASGFRVFLPLFALSLVIHFNLGDYLGLGLLSDSFNWLGSTLALIVLGIATLVEIIAYYLPFIDNLLDTLAIPLAGIAGTIMVASQMVDMPQVVVWTLAIIAGGGTASLISGTMATARAASTGTTAGLGNAAVSTTETGASVVMTFVSFVVPILAFILVLVLFFGSYKMFRFFRRKKSRKIDDSST